MQSGSQSESRICDIEFRTLIIAFKSLFLDWKFFVTFLFLVVNDVSVIDWRLFFELD